jgi:hypothetical protein
VKQLASGPAVVEISDEHSRLIVVRRKNDPAFLIVNGISSQALDRESLYSSSNCHSIAIRWPKDKLAATIQ